MPPRVAKIGRPSSAASSTTTIPPTRIAVLCGEGSNPNRHGTPSPKAAASLPRRSGEACHTIPSATAKNPAGMAACAIQSVFNVFCNGKTILSNLNIRDQAGENRPLVRKIKGLEPNAQGKLLLEFVPVTRYATVSAIEVIPE